MNETRTLAKLVAEMRYQDLPKNVVAKTKELTLDQLGAQIGLSTKSFVRPAYEYVRALGGKKESTIVNYGDKTTAENAAFVNATFGSSFEIDDADLTALVHSGSVTIPTALALGEREHSTGKDYILAVVLGYEVIHRVGSAIARSALHRGFHTTSLSGPFGAAAAAGSILKFDKDKVLNALGIAGSHASGLREYTHTGSEVKRIHAGIAAHGGLRSALLAGFGLDGPTTILEGEGGFCRAFADDYNLKDITKDFGKEFAVMQMWSKSYACNGMLQAPIDAIHMIRREHPFKLEDIEEVIMGSNELAIHGLDKTAPAARNFGTSKNKKA